MIALYGPWIVPSSSNDNDIETKAEQALILTSFSISSETNLLIPELVKIERSEPHLFYTLERAKWSEFCLFHKFERTKRSKVCLFHKLDRSKRSEVCLFQQIWKNKAKPSMFIPQIWKIEAEQTRLVPEIGKIEAKKTNWIEVKRTEAVFLNFYGAQESIPRNCSLSPYL